MTERQNLLHALLVTPAHMLSEPAILTLGQILNDSRGDQYADFAKIHERNAQAIRMMGESGVVSHLESRSEKVEADVPKIGILNIRGTIAKESSWWYDIIGTKALSTQLRKLAQQSNVKGIILKIESGGGQALATDILKKAILEVRASGKKVIAYVEDLCGSAAYDIASVCDEIWVNHPLAQVGSIGTFLPLVNYQGIWEKMGAKFHEIYATKSTEKNKSFREALKGNYARIRKDFIDPFNEVFLASVQLHRPRINAEKTLKGNIFFYEEAKKYGLVDKLGTLEECGQAIFQNPTPNPIPDTVSSKILNSVSDAVSDANSTSVYSAPTPHRVSTQMSDKMPDEMSNEISDNLSLKSNRLNLMSGYKSLFSPLQNIPKYFQKFISSAKVNEETGQVIIQENQIESLSEEMIRLKERNDELEAQITKKEEALQALQAQYDTDKETWQTEKTELESKVSGLEADVEAKTKVVAENEKTITDQKNALKKSQEMLLFMGEQPGAMPSQAEKSEGDTPQKLEPWEDPDTKYFP